MSAPAASIVLPEPWSRFPLDEGDFERSLRGRRVEMRSQRPDVSVTALRSVELLLHDVRRNLLRAETVMFATMQQQVVADGRVEPLSATCSLSRRGTSYLPVSHLFPRSRWTLPLVEGVLRTPRPSSGPTAGSDVGDHSDLQIGRMVLPVGEALVVDATGGLPASLGPSPDAISPNVEWSPDAGLGIWHRRWFVPAADGADLWVLSFSSVCVRRRRQLTEIFDAMARSLRLGPAAGDSTPGSGEECAKSEPAASPRTAAG